MGAKLKMALRDELLKAIWHAFTALDVDKSGKVSKSQLKVRAGLIYFTTLFSQDEAPDQTVIRSRHTLD